MIAFALGFVACLLFFTALWLLPWHFTFVDSAWFAPGLALLFFLGRRFIPGWDVPPVTHVKYGVLSAIFLSMLLLVLGMFNVIPYFNFLQA